MIRKAVVAGLGVVLADREAAREREPERQRRASCAQSTHVLGEAPPEVLVHLLEDVQVGERLAPGRHEAGALRERGPPKEVAPRLGAERLHRPLEAEAQHRRIEPRHVVAEGGRGERADAGVAAQRVEEEGPLAFLEGPRQPVVLEEAVDVLRAGDRPARGPSATAAGPPLATGRGSDGGRPGHSG